MRNKHKWYPILLLGLALLLASLVIACQPSPSSAPPQVEPKQESIHYVNEDYAYSIDYPRDWIKQELNPNEVVIKPSDSEYNQIQIAAYRPPSGINSMPDSVVTKVSEAGLKQFVTAIGGTNLAIVLNQRASQQWDWVTMFTFFTEKTPLQGAQFIKETESISYIVSIIQCFDWTEGNKVKDTFTILSEASPEQSEIGSYLVDFEFLLDEVTDLSSEISDMYKTATQLDPNTIVQKCHNFALQYDDILQRLVALDCPQECLELREYTVDAITYSKQEVTEFGAAFATGDKEHLYKSEQYYNDGQRALIRAANEWDRLNKH